MSKALQEIRQEGFKEGYEMERLRIGTLVSKNLYNDGYSLDFIFSVVNLTMDEIRDALGLEKVAEDS